MFRKNRTNNSGIATKRVKDLLDEHVRMLTKKNRTFQNIRDEGYYLEQNIDANCKDDYVKIGYTVQKKFLSRTFCLEFRTTVSGVHFQENFTLKLSFRGFPKINNVYFKGKKEGEKYAGYFNDPELLDRLKNIAKTIDLDFITIEYNKSLAAFVIRVAPIPGGVIWIVFPPLYYKMRLKQDEIDALWYALVVLRKHTVKLINKEKWR